MPDITTPGEYRVGPHVIKVESGQVCTYPAGHDTESITYYDEMQTALESEDAVVTDVGELRDESYSKVGNNPFAPVEQPATFVQEADPVTPWADVTPMVGGSKYSNLGRTFICRQSHFSQPLFEPVEDLGGVGLLALWTLIPTDIGQWEPGVSYVVDQEVEYLGVSYRCIQAHTSIVGWEPPNVPALWAVV